MGPVVTINSATLVNKGLEVIEAHLLFGIPFDRIDVVVHPHLAWCTRWSSSSTAPRSRRPARPTMLIPIALGLGWPDRVPDAAPAVRLDHGRQTWEFFPLDDEAFPAVALARRAGALGGTAPGGLQRRQRGLRRGVPRRSDAVHRHRPHRSSRVLAAHDVPSEQTDLTVDDVLAADAWARDQARPWTQRDRAPLR